MIIFTPIRQETWSSADNAAYAAVELGIRRFGLDRRSTAATPNENVVSYFLYYALDSMHNGDSPGFIHAVQPAGAGQLLGKAFLHSHRIETSQPNINIR